ncbi:hypothetical protein NC653_006893 [Populus alba x Populus x berolinensis]|uniref:Uncharacterized protein n=1 Tax=Populus alba x Populus x berolinensis TaxID=444605 RepID=A0AAD6WCQ6_9ROSI|nr:hypothetical protein NC653_006893 [Populus alba x Populus x berolinensis]
MDLVCITTGYMKLLTFQINYTLCFFENTKNHARPKTELRRVCLHLHAFIYGHVPVASNGVVS